MDAGPAGGKRMTTICQSTQTGVGFLSGTLEFFDCQAQNIAAAGYQALASPGSGVSLAFVSLLTIFIAIFGIKMMFGAMPSTQDLGAAAIKIGVALTLAISWPAFRTLVYDTVLKGPGEIFADIGQAASLPGSDGGMADRLTGVDRAIRALIAAGTGRLDVTTRLDSSDGLPDNKSPINDDFAFGMAQTALFLGVIGGVGLVRIAGGMLLALAPIFAACLLFETTRGLFFGWLKSLIAIALSSLATALVLGVELAMLEPWLAATLDLRSARIAVPSAPFELMAMASAFAIVMFGLMAFCTWLAFSSRLGAVVVPMVHPARDKAGASIEQPEPARTIEAPRDVETSERVRSIAQAIDLADQRNPQSKSTMTEDKIEQSPSEKAAASSRDMPLGQTYMRTKTRALQSGTMREAR